MSVDREQVRRDSPSIERDVVTVRGFLDYPTASGRDVYLKAVEALDRLALDAHRAEQAERELADWRQIAERLSFKDLRDRDDLDEAQQGVEYALACIAEWQERAEQAEARLVKADTLAEALRQAGHNPKPEAACLECRALAAYEQEQEP